MPPNGSWLLISMKYFISPEWAGLTVFPCYWITNVSVPSTAAARKRLRTPRLTHSLFSACVGQAMLLLLQVLHIIWTHLFLRILWRIATESTGDASRKEYEGGSESDGDEPADADTAAKKRK